MKNVSYIKRNFKSAKETIFKVFNVRIRKKFSVSNANPLEWEYACHTDRSVVFPVMGCYLIYLFFSRTQREQEKSHQILLNF